MGYGFVDAYAAVQAACAAYGASLNLTITGSNTVSEEEIFSIASLPAGATVQWQFNEDFLQMCSSTGAGNICLMPNPSYFMDCPGSSTIGATVNYNGCSFSVPNKSVYVGTPPKAEHISSIKNSGRVPYKPCTFTDKVTYHGIDMFPPFYGLIEAEWVSLPTPEVTLVNPTTGGLLGGNHFTQELQVVKLGFSMLNPAHIQVRLRNYCGWSDFVTIEYKKDAGICRPIMFSYSPNPTTDELTITFEQLPTMEDSDELSVVQNISVQSITTNNQMETYSVKLFDASGTVLRQIQFTHGYQDGVPQPVIFNLSSLRKGTYFLHVEGGGELVREQIIVAK
ncbi:MAG: T9SS type A sorting domain-containing protein [Bacteroidales bacterium]|jgi:hypothetical protein|nr:T9SS type A sorting domain-containing protein [Bacteroidales bacterium]